MREPKRLTGLTSRTGCLALGVVLHRRNAASDFLNTVLFLKIVFIKVLAPQLACLINLLWKLLGFSGPVL